MKRLDRSIDRLRRAVASKKRGHRPRAKLRRELVRLVATKIAEEIRNPELPLGATP